MEKPFPVRKEIRLKGYDYSQPNAYFITICTDKKKNLFWNLVNEATFETIPLSHDGKIAEAAICEMPVHYPTITLEKYVVMPNHVHLLILIHAGEQGKDQSEPTISRMVQQLKGIITKKIGFSVWQPRFYDHVVRNQQDYDEIWQYIEENPWKWKEDRFYNEGM